MTLAALIEIAEQRAARRQEAGDRLIQDGNNWWRGSYQGRWFVAKVYDEPSVHGINDGRISKLTVYEYHRPTANQIAYNYDRGLDIDDLPAEALVDLVAYIEEATR